MKVNELLNKNNWIKGSYSLDANNRQVYENSPTATQFCLVGAIKKCYLYTSFENFDKVLKATGDYCDNNYGLTIIGFNDRAASTFVDIQKLIDDLDI